MPNLFQAPPGEETIYQAFARLGIGPGGHVTREQYPLLPEWLRERLESQGRQTLARRDEEDRVATCTEEVHRMGLCDCGDVDQPDPDDVSLHEWQDTVEAPPDHDQPRETP